MARLRLVLLSHRRESVSSNIFAEIPGTSKDAGIVLVGAHRDTAPNVSGAIDNASGVAILLELARAFADSPMKPTLQFVVWGAEKAGMAGSRHAISHMSQSELDRLICTISIDGVGTWGAVDHCFIAGSEAIANRTRDVYGSSAIDVSQGYFGSDSEMFAMHGVPGFSFGQIGPALGLLHTTNDELAMIDPDALGRCARFVQQLIGDIGCNPAEWSEFREVPGQTSEDIRSILGMSGWLD